MKPVYRKLILICLGVSLVVAIVLTTKLIWFKPFSIDHFFERSYYELLLEDPEALTRSGLLNEFPFFDRNTDLTDPSTSQELHRHEQGKRILSMLDEYDKEDLDELDRSSYEVFHWFLQHNVQGEQFLFYNYPVNQFSGAHLTFPGFMSRSHRITDLKDANDYLTRLNKWPEKVSGLIEAMEHRRELGIVPPTSIVRKVKDQCKRITNRPVDQDPLFTGFTKGLEGINDIESADSTELSQECRRLIFETIHPAYRELTDYLDLLEKSSTEVHGVWHLDNGKAFYRYALKSSTTLDISPDELYHIGINEKERIETEIALVLEEIGVENKISVQEGIRAIHEQSTSLATEEELLQLYRAEIDKAIAGTSPFFLDFRFDELEVKRMDPMREKSGATALYNRSGEKGILHVNLGDSTSFNTSSIPTTVHHEAIPGHHLQRSIRLKLRNLPTFRRFLPFTAYNEGWAMYCEVLGDELGLLDTPEKRLGMLELDLLRTVRLICDIGVHHKKWLRGQAIAYMVSNTGISEQKAEREIDRFIVNPGQGCAYKVGQLKMLELRDRMKAELGSYYDIRQFHDLVLRNGAVPLDILDKMVDREIERLIAESQTLVPEPI